MTDQRFSSRMSLSSIGRRLVLLGGVVVGVVVLRDLGVVLSTCYLRHRRKRDVGKRRPDAQRPLNEKLMLLRWPYLVWEEIFGSDPGVNINVDPTESTTEVLFFPDDGIPCQDFHSARAGCPRGDECPFLHEDTCYHRLATLLRSANSTIDVCVFCLTSPELVGLLIDACKTEAVGVRVITDGEQLRVPGSQVGRMRNEGIRVRHDASSFLMHHKFALIDGELLLNGSFNWTRSAITGNQENLVISRDAHLVAAFQAKFEALWEDFNPGKQTGFTEKPPRTSWVTADYIR